MVFLQRNSVNGLILALKQSSDHTLDFMLFICKRSTHKSAVTEKPRGMSERLPRLQTFYFRASALQEDSVFPVAGKAYGEACISERDISFPVKSPTYDEFI